MKSFKVNEKITRYEIGNPIDTEAVIIKGYEEIQREIPFLNVHINEEIQLDFTMEKNHKVYGLGQNIRGINKRGWIYESFCTDEPNHAPDKKSLYGAHNFFILDGKIKFGVYIDFPGKITYDIGYSNKNQFKINIDGKDVNIYIIKGERLREIVKDFLAIIGKGYVPPKWAFGYLQSRWSYPTGKDVEKIADKFIENDIPCDGICLDLDYMENFKDFSLSEERFSDFKELVNRLKKKGIKIVPIIDAGVKIEKGYDVYEEGVRNNYFVTNKDGEPFVGAVWPGKVHFPDFLNKDARKWFGKKYKKLIDLGVEGFWNDMNEPAIFYSETGIERAYEIIDELRNTELNIHSFFKLKDSINTISNNIEDYKAFYHNTDKGIINHYDVHNLYGYNMTKAAAEGFEHIDKNKRFLLFSRASAIGAHRYGGIWTGDNCSWWEHLIMNIKMLPSINMCGFIYSGADTCGFGSNVDSELAIRWNQFSIFAPLYRNHSASGTRNQEPFAFDEDTKNIISNAVKFRYAMIPYLYSEYMKSIDSGDMLIAPLSFDYDDEYLPQVEDQLLVGESIMIAPVYEQNKRGRYVYLPEDMLLWKIKEYTKENLTIIKKGHNYIDVNIDEICLFIRKNKIFVYGESAQSTEVLCNKTLNLIVFLEDTAEYILYDDDGISKDYLNGKSSSIKVVITLNEDKPKILVENKENKNIEKLNITIITIDGKEFKETLNI